VAFSVLKCSFNDTILAFEIPFFPGLKTKPFGMTTKPFLEQIIGHDNLKISIDGHNIFRHILKKGLVIVIRHALKFTHPNIPLM